MSTKRRFQYLLLTLASQIKIHAIMKHILLLIAHPKLQESKANKALIDAAHKVQNVTVKDIYAEPFSVENYYDDFKRADTIIFQLPFYWGSAPSQMKKWIDEIFMAFCENPGVTGKSLLIATTTGSEYEAYRAGGRDQFTIDELLRPYQFTALYSGMDYLTPFVVYSTAAPNAEEYIYQGAEEYRKLLERLVE